MSTPKILLPLLCCLCTSAFAQTAHAPDTKLLSAELATFLGRQGDFCLGKSEWPIEVTERDARMRTRDAVQMPVLEKKGLVVSSAGTAMRKVGDVEKETPVMRYALTDAGAAFYLRRDTRDARRDLCAGRVSLDKVVGWTGPELQEGREQLTVNYTYHFAAAKWGTDPEVQNVFPVLANLIRGEGTQQLTQAFRFEGDRWVAVDPRTDAR